MDSDLLTPAEHQFYEPFCGPRRWEQSKLRTLEELTKDANTAHDNLRALVAERDRLQALCRQLVKDVEREKRWRQAITAALIFTWGSWMTAFWYVFKFAAPYIVKGMQAK